MPGPPPVTVPTEWAVELEDALCQALGAWLSSAPAGLGAVPSTNQPAVSVFGDWSEADVSLVYPRAVILRTGEPEIEDIDPVVVGTPVFVEGNDYLYTWLLGNGELPIEIEVWAGSKAQRGDALARLRAALTMGNDVTLAGYFAARAALGAVIPPHDPVASEILLAIPAPWAGTAAYYFERPRLYESPNDAGDREWRASYSGTVSYEISLVTTNPALTSVQISAALAGSMPLTSASAPSPGGAFVATVTPTTTTYTRR